jgi:adenosylcobinamide-GDP ribazoletransferase
MLRTIAQREIRLFFTALMFFTRIPCPSWVDHSEEYLHKSSRYFPLIGWIVGGFSGAVLVASALLFPLPVAVLLCMTASLLLTGAFHEDGLADMCDGFGGGWTKEQILRIMQDSRLGTFGACGLALALALKFAALLFIAERSSPAAAALALVAAHAASRLTAVTFLRTHSYARADDDAGAKAKPLATKISAGEYAFAALCGALPTVLFAQTLSWQTLLLLAPLPLAHLYLGRFFQRWIGGYTGDCLGATQQIAEILFYLALVAVTQWNAQESGALFTPLGFP